MREIGVRVARGKARVTIQCITDGCEQAKMRHRTSGKVSESYAIDVPSPDGRPRREYFLCSRCGRIYKVIVFCSREVRIMSLDPPSEENVPLQEAHFKGVRLDSDEPLGP